MASGGWAPGSQPPRAVNVRTPSSPGSTGSKTRTPEPFEKWDPMQEHFLSTELNTYDLGPGKDMPCRPQHKRNMPVPGLGQAEKGSQIDLYVTGIPNGMTEKGLENLFSRAGKVKSVRKMTSALADRDDTYGFVTFGSVAEADCAIRDLNGWSVEHHTIRVKVALSEEQRRQRREEKKKTEEFLQSLKERDSGTDDELTRYHRANGAPSPRGASGSSSGVSSATPKSSGSPARPTMPAVGRGALLKQKLSQAEAGGLQASRKKSPAPPKTTPQRDVIPSKMKDFERSFESHFDVEVGDDFAEMAQAMVLNSDEAVKLEKKPSQPSSSPKASPSSVLQKDAKPPSSPGSGTNQAPAGPRKGKRTMVTDVPLEQLVLNEPVKAIVTHFVNPGDFWVMLEKENNFQKMESLRTSMDMKFQRSLNIGPQSYMPEVRELCAAQFTKDEGWYRAVVNGIQLNGSLDVTYVDYGNGEEIMATRVRALEPYMITLPRQGVRCSLAGVVPAVGTQWSKEAVDMCVRTMSPRINITLVREEKLRPHGCKRHVQVTGADGKQISEMLLAAGLAKKSPQEQAAARTGPSHDKKPCGDGGSGQGINAPSQQEKRPNSGQHQQKQHSQSGPGKTGSPGGKTSSPRGNQREKSDEGSPRACALGSKQTPGQQKQRSVSGPAPSGMPSEAGVVTCCDEDRPVISCVSADLQAGQEVRIMVVHVESPSQFWVHWTAQAGIEELVHLMTRIKEHYSKIQPDRRGNWKIGDYVVAKFSEDKEFYRGQIQDVQNGEANVQFIDYGNSEKVPLSQLYVLDEQFYGVASQAINCGLFGIQHALPGTWSTEATQYFRKCTSNEAPMAATVAVKDGNYIFLEIEAPGGERTLQDQMIEAGFSKRIKTASQLGVTQQGKESKGSLASPRANSQIPVKSRIPVNRIKDIGIAKIPENKMINVNVVAAYSPSEVYIQLFEQDNGEALSKISQELETINFVTGHKPEIGEVVCARYRKDTFWYRAEVKDIDKAGRYNVFFVDWGNTDTVTSKDVAELPSSLVTYPCQTVCCVLNGVKDKTSTWHEKILDGPCKMRILESQGPYVVELFGAQTNDLLNKLIVDQGFAMAEKITADQLGDIRLPDEIEIKVFVTDAKDPGEIHVQIYHDEVIEKVFSLSQLLNAHKHVKGYKPSVGELVCALFKVDNGWYRAEVLSEQGGMYRVKFIDFGNVEEGVGCESISKFPDEMADFPVLAVLCKLDGVDPKTCAWEPDMLVNKVYLMSVVKTGKPCLVELLTEDKKESVNRMLHSMRTQLPEAGTSPVCQRNQDLHGVQGNRDPMQKSVVTLEELGVVKFPRQNNFLVMVTDARSPEAVFVQVIHESNINVLTELASGLEAFQHVSGYEPKVGEVVCAKFSEDGKWYRAVVESCSGTTYQVMFFDFGNCDQLKKDSIEELPEKFKAYPVQGTCCQLAGVGAKTARWDPALLVLRYFNMSVEGETGNVPVVQLTDEGNSVNEMLVESGLAERAVSESPETTVLKSPEPGPSKVCDKSGSRQDDSTAQKPPITLETLGVAQPAANRSSQVIVSSVVSVEEIYVQICEKPFISHQEHLAREAESLRPKGGYEPIQGEVVCVKYEDEGWYRAAVLGRKKGIYRVHFIDFGNVEQVEGTDIARLPESLLGYPAQAVRCQLSAAAAAKWKLEDLVDQHLELTAPEDGEAYVVVEPTSTSKRTSMETATVAQSQGFVPGPVVSGVSQVVMASDLPPLSVPSNPVHVVESYTISPAEFWVQILDQEELTKLGEIMASIKHYAEGGKPYRPIIGELVAAKYQEEWSRAKVLQVDTQKASAKVYFVDFGNTEVVSYEDVHKVERSAGVLAGQAVACSLKDIHSLRPDGSWDPRVTDVLKDLAVGCKLVAQLTPIRGTSKYSAILVRVDTELNINAQLVKDGLVQSLPLAAQAQRNRSPPVTQHQLKKEGNKVVLLSAVTLQEFYLHDREDDNYEQLRQMVQATEDLTAQFKNKVEKYIPDIGELVAAEFCLDGDWYRALVLEKDDTKATLFFVDYGNTDTAPYHNICQLPAAYASLPTQAIKCSLAGVDSMDAADNQLVDTFRRLIPQDVPIHAKVVNYVDGVHYVDLNVQTSQVHVPSVRNEIEKFCPARARSGRVSTLSTQTAVRKQKAEMAGALETGRGSSTGKSNLSSICMEQVFLDEIDTKKLPEVCDVMVFEVKDPSSFVALELSRELSREFQALTEQMATYCSSTPPTPGYQPMIGELCIAFYPEDNSWNRAMVKQHDTKDSVIVRYVDYGNVEVCPLRDLRPIRREHLNLPIQACQCSIAGVSPVGPSWQDVASKKFRELVRQQKMQCKVKKMEGNKHFVDLVIVETRENVASKLVHCGLAMEAGYELEPEDRPIGGSPVPIQDVGQSDTERLVKVEMENAELKQMLQRMEQQMKQLLVQKK